MPEDDDIEAKILKAQTEDKDARLERDKTERAKLFGEHPEWFLPGAGFIMEPFPLMRTNLPGCVVMRLPTMPEQQQFREACLGQGASVKGHALTTLGAACRVYPEKDTYREMVKANPAIADQCANVIYRASEGKEREAGKG